MDAATDDRRLRPTDYLWLLLLCAALAAPALLDGRWLTTHEATHCLNVREMFDSGNVLIPTYGGRPWLERPPVPHWFTGLFAELFADTSTTWAMRIGSIIVAAGAVLAVAWSVAGCLGRGFGIASGAVLATFREFAAYAVGPETDIFIASFVTLSGALFLRAEFFSEENEHHLTTSPPRRPTFFGPRPWPVLGVFVVLGLTNAMKGPLFGTAFLASAMGIYFLAGRHWAGLRRYVWFWGWLAYLVIGGVLPLLGYLTSSRNRGRLDARLREAAQRGIHRRAAVVLPHARPVESVPVDVPGAGGIVVYSPPRLSRWRPAVAIPLGLGPGSAGGVLCVPGQAPSLHAELHRAVGADRGRWLHWATPNHPRLAGVGTFAALRSSWHLGYRGQSRHWHSRTRFRGRVGSRIQSPPVGRWSSRPVGTSQSPGRTDGARLAFLW